MPKNGAMDLYIVFNDLGKLNHGGGRRIQTINDNLWRWIDLSLSNRSLRTSTRAQAD